MSKQHPRARDIASGIARSNFATCSEESENRSPGTAEYEAEPLPEAEVMFHDDISAGRVGVVVKWDSGGIKSGFKFQIIRELLAGIGIAAPGISVDAALATASTPRTCPKCGYDEGALEDERGGREDAEEEARGVEGRRAMWEEVMEALDKIAVASDFAGSGPSSGTGAYIEAWDDARRVIRGLEP